jgi:hypothetical protein
MNPIYIGLSDLSHGLKAERPKKQSFFSAKTPPEFVKKK